MRPSSRLSTTRSANSASCSTVVALAARHRGAGQREHGDLDIDVGPNLPGLDAAAQHGPDHVPPWLDQRLRVPRHQPRVLLPLAEQQRVLPGPPRVGRVLRHHGDEGDQVIAGGPAAGVGQRALQRAQRGQEEVLLVVPAPVDRGLADAGPGGDLLDAQAVGALLSEQLQGGLDDRLLGALAARAAGSAPRGGPVIRARLRVDAVVARIRAAFAERPELILVARRLRGEVDGGRIHHSLSFHAG